jgi:D-alanyl-D-alanine dipeptidase
MAKHNQHHSTRAQVFLLGVVLLTFVALLIAFIMLKDQRFLKTEDQTQALGGKPFVIIETYQRAEDALFYADVAAKHALPEALVAIARRGGYFGGDLLENEDPLNPVEPSDCGSYVANLWNSESQECYPDISKNLGVTFQAFHEDLLSEYSLLVFPPNNYAYTAFTSLWGALPVTTIKGVALRPLTILVSQSPMQAAPIALPPLNVNTGAFVPINFPAGSSSRCAPSGMICMLDPEVNAHLQSTIAHLQTNYGSDHYDILITSALRTYETQIALFSTCAPNCHGSVARPGTSMHEFGRAIDIHMYKNGVEMDTGPSGFKYAYNVYDGFTAEQRAVHKEIERIMCKEGWIRYRNEWWHFEYGSPRWKEAQSRGVCVY